MSAPNLPPEVPIEFQIYNSYEVDPRWQRKFTAVWGIAVAIGVLFSLPHFIKSVRKGYTWASITGITEDLRGVSYKPVASQRDALPTRRPYAQFHGVVAMLRSFTMWTMPFVSLDVGQLILIFVYFFVVLVCMTMHAILVDNSNRAGFIAFAQLPVVFLLATKNSPLSLLLGAGRGWEKINFMHRWAGRGFFLTAAVHGSLWIRHNLHYNLPILGEQKETSGIAAFGVLCCIVLFSLKPVRAYSYQLFFVVHVLGYVSFFITICYHTIFAVPWIFPPLAFYGFDLFLRFMRYRIKDAVLIPCDEQMTIIHVNDCDGGWAPGQHVRLRVFFNGRIFESHPLTIMSALPRITCLSNHALAFGARVQGDWTRALNEYARANSTRMQDNSTEASVLSEGGEKTHDTGCLKEVSEKPTAAWLDEVGAPVRVMIDGPYGGSSVDLGDYENVLLIAGGSGATFSLGMLDDIIGRCVKLGRPDGERTRRIEFAWCIKSFACLQWFAPMLMEIALAAENSTVDLHISVFVTCLCDPEAVPPIPNCDVLIERPTSVQLLDTLIAQPVPSSKAEPGPESNAEAGIGAALTVGNCGGGLAVCAAGPESLIREAKNALARVAMARGLQLGKVACHTELYAL